MATQQYTIAKVAGHTAEKIFERFQAWHDSRATNEKEDWETGQWPQAYEHEAEQFALKLHDQSYLPPIMYYCSYVDQWSSNLPHIHLAEHGLLEIWTPEMSLGCLMLPITSAAKRRLKRVAEDTKGFGEDHLFARRVLEASTAWAPFVSGGVIIFVRKTICGSVSDEEVLESLKHNSKFIEQDASGNRR